jgi:hypothetical protein
MESFVSSCDTFVFCLHLFHNSSQITFALIWIVKQGRSIFITYLLYTIFEQTILFFLKGMFSLSLHFISCYTGTLICPSMAKYFSDYCSFIINLEWKLYKNQFCVLQVWKRHLRSFSFTLTQTYMPMYTCMCIDVHIIYILYILYMYFAYMYILYMCIYIYMYIYVYLCFCSTRIWTQSFALARQVLYSLCYATSPFLIQKPVWTLILLPLPSA